MIILAMDTSSSRLSLALWEHGRLLAGSGLVPQKRQAEVILGEIENLFARAGLAPKQLGGLAVGLGPGSFTGLRVGIAVAQGLAQVLGLPVAGVSSFRAAAAGSQSALALVLEDARRDMVYAALYANQEGACQPVWPESLLALREVKARLPQQPLTLTGPGAEKYYPELLSDGSGHLALISAPACFPEAGIIAGLAEPLLAGGGVRPQDLVPLYLRRTQAEEQRQPLP